MALLPAALLLAVLQGLTEFFPVSSSGHLVIAQHLFDFNNSNLLFDVVLHLGTLLAVVVFFFRDIASLCTRPRQPDNLRLILMIVLASIPTGLMGFLFKDHVEKLFAAPRSAGWFLLATALLLLLAKFLRLRQPPWWLAALIVGLFQGLAIAPGLSRSGATISVCLILGLGFAFSFRFSFLLSIPAVLGAALLEWRDLPAGAEFSLPLLLGFAAAAATGLLALRLLKKFVLKDKFHYFAFYCLAAGMAVILFI